jgi:hypothetical protein
MPASKRSTNPNTASGKYSMGVQKVKEKLTYRHLQIQCETKVQTPCLLQSSDGCLLNILPAVHNMTRRFDATQTTHE